MGLVLAPQPAAAADPDPRCVQAMHAGQFAAPPEAVLRIEHARITHDFTRGRDELFAIIRRHGSADASARMTGRRVHGLTHSSLGYYLQAAFEVRGLPDGTVCLWPRTVAAELGYSDTTVYVTRDYSAGSCAFEAVLAHENEHVAINNAVVRDHADRLRATLTHLTRTGFPLAGQDAKALHAKAQDMLNTGFREALTPLLVDRSRRNAAIDTEDGYRGLNAQCDSW